MLCSAANTQPLTASFIHGLHVAGPIERLVSGVDGSGNVIECQGQG